jgi:hypothetical protein
MNLTIEMYEMEILELITEINILKAELHSLRNREERNSKYRLYNELVRDDIIDKCKEGE